MRLDEYITYDGVGLAELVRQRQVSPRELAETALSAIQQVNPQINAVIETLEDWPTRFAQQPQQGYFYGVPFLLKDHVTMQQGLRLEFGSRLLHGVLVAPIDTDLGQRYKQAGLNTLGRTNCPEMAYCPSTEPVLFGPTRNPWNLERSAGGSSGGSAAAVAAGIVPMAHATDGGGSIRIPAAWCGLVGLKPTRMRNPPGPTFGEAFYGMGVEHVVSRTVRDTALMLDATHGPGVGDKYQIPPPAQPYAKVIQQLPSPLRIAFSAKTYNGVPVEPACVQALEATARHLEALGHHLEEAAPEFDAESFDKANLIMWCSFLAAAILNLGQMVGRKPSPENLEATVWASFQHGLGLKALDLEYAQAVQNTVTRVVGAFHQHYDLFLTPTMPSTALPLGLLNANDPDLDAQGWYDHAYAARLPFTMPANMTGLPAISLPLQQSPEGLPVGIQLTARFGGEDTLLQLAAQLEQTIPWRNRAPSISVG
ncbi:amidase [Meiothermus sp.]|uniref:amidase n=1 Tax=Meiothermus sp. TaxID=1955249 RepID=UPI00307DEF99